MGTNVRQGEGGGMAFVDDASSSEMFHVGGRYRNRKTARIPILGVAATTGGALLAWMNPENVAIIVEKIDIDFITPSTGASAGSFGTAANGTTSSANLIDSYAMATAAAVVNNYANSGTNGKNTQKVAVGGYVTGSGSATSAGLVATVYIHYYLT